MTRWLLVAWALTEIALAIVKRRGSGGATSHDRGSLAILFIAFSIVCALGNILSERHVAPMAFDPAIAAAIIFLTGIVLRTWAILTLGRHFTMNVQIADDHQLITRGPYRLLRHPSYTGILLIMAGAGLAMRDWASFAVMALLPLLPLGYRIAIEERALAGQFGEKWEAHRANTWRLIPFVF